MYPAWPSATKMVPTVILVRVGGDTCPRNPMRSWVRGEDRGGPRQSRERVEWVGMISGKVAGGGWRVAASRWEAGCGEAARRRGGERRRAVAVTSQRGRTMGMNAP